MAVEEIGTEVLAMLIHGRGYIEPVKEWLRECGKNPTTLGDKGLGASVGQATTEEVLAMGFVFDGNAQLNDEVQRNVTTFLGEVKTLEEATGSNIVICQDGKAKGYYIRCAISAEAASGLLCLDARLNPQSPDSYRANRDLWLTHNTYMRMREDAENGREFSDIIVEYNKEYFPEKPLKVWGGQHRSKALQEALQKGAHSRYHGFRVYFCLSKEQRTDLALISNTNINISDDLFDRLLEETYVGPALRKWCLRVDLLRENEDFPDRRSGSERVTAKLARTFIVNFHLGREWGGQLAADQLDKNIYEPHLCESGASLDPQYDRIVRKVGDALWDDPELIAAGKAFCALHRAQQDAIKRSSSNLKSFRNKALTDSVLSAWAYIAGLLNAHPDRLRNHLEAPKAPKGCPDPLNAEEMSKFKHDQDPPTYRGLGTRSASKDRQRMAQVFLARSLQSGQALERKLLNQAVSQVIGLRALNKGYSR